MLPDALLLAVFFACVALVFHSYVLYPLMLGLLGRGRAVSPPVIDDAALPSVTILVAAHNEASVIGDRVRNALASDYPEDRLQVLIASDGSSDDTEAIVRSFTDERLRLLAHQPNRGKTYTLNRALEEARGDIIVMSDANTEFEPRALRQLVARLETEDKPLAVCGKLILTDPATGNNVDGLYWRYESWMKYREGALGAALGANGGIYAFRRAQYRAIPDNTILDDMSIPLYMKLQHGGAVVFEESAVAREEVPAQMSDEFGRRVRIGVGAFQSLTFLWPLLSPRYGLTAFGFLSHKLLRWFTPHLVLLALLCALLGGHMRFFQGVLLVAIVAMVLAWWGRNVSGDALPAKLLRLLSLFVSMNAALFVGFVRWWKTPQTGTWKRTARE